MYRMRVSTGKHGGWVTAWWLACLLAAVPLLAGCPGKSTQQPPAEPAYLDEPAAGAEPVQVSSAFTVDRGTVTLSKSGGGRVQWHNASGETIFIIFEGAGTGELIPAGKWSAEHRVCYTCNSGDSFPYKVYRLVNGVPTDPTATSNGLPPAEPKIDVGT